MPLPEKRLRELRDWNAVRIERFQNTMRNKRESRWTEVRERAPQKFTHGTCNLIYGNRDIAEYVLMALEYLRGEFAPKGGV